MQNILLGFLLCAALMIVTALLMLYLGQPLLRRLSEWLLARRGLEKLGRPIRICPDNSPYERWLATARSSIPVHDCLYVEDVRTIRLGPWEELGENIRGLYLRLADYQVTDGRIIEIPPAGATRLTRHMFEMAIYFLGGPGHTVIHRDGKAPQRIDWNQHSIYSIPLNARYQHFNDSQEPCRLLAITGFPFVLNATNDETFIFDNPFGFEGRTQVGNLTDSAAERIPANREFRDFVADALTTALQDHSGRGKGVRNVYWNMSGNSMINIGVSEMPGRSPKRAHRSTSDATVLMLSGHGYAVTWPDGAWHRRIRVDWKEGTLMAQPIFWYRQFFNLGDASARNLTVSASSLVKNLGLRFVDQLENDLPAIRKQWREERRQQTQKGNRSGSVS